MRWSEDLEELRLGLIEARDELFPFVGDAVIETLLAEFDAAGRRPPFHQCVSAMVARATGPDRGPAPRLR